MGNAWAIPPCGFYRIGWGLIMEIPWNGSMGNALGFHGLALGLLIGHSMEVLSG